ncbi:alpha/beta fold hydrolase [Streptacidiphilus jiangxiensis]|uniref:Pimeloyl-ACP methyl ester carboxylesterase n=1 Tax=Streptacidiphilus jiangxiensis TaxID=235985 RepID=A0A1H7HI32_STRJI|nr:alpha/beta hydrolase [Streptacidiphilus jiangxiensis]SEK49828.1 Pimeloyl-ACP methyl ester carboxylesterase [Streptacidiphilus jiangxiensis]
MSETLIPSTQYLTVNHAGGTGRIAYDDNGAAGPLVVLIPGMGDNRTTYRFVVPALTAAGYRVVTTDLRGAGESDATFTDYTTTAVAGDLRALIAHLDAGPALLVSNSYSAGAGVIAAADEPEAFAGLVLTGPFVRTAEQNLVARLGTVVVGRFGPAWMAFWTTLFATTKPEDFADAKARLATQMGEPGRMAALRAMFASGHDASERRLREIKELALPVQVVMGSKDPDFKPNPQDEAEWIVDHAGGELVMVDGAGHYPSAEAPQAVIDALLPFAAKAFGAQG